MELSIIIPAYNRKETLKRCLLSLDEQDYPKDKYEFIVVDDGSSDGTIEFVQALAEKHRNFHYIQQYRKGPASARNLGIKKARGEIIGFTDDDCALDRDWVRLMIESHKKNPEIIAVGGLTLVPYKKANIMIGQSLSNGAIQINLNGQKEVIFLPTCNVTFKRRIFEEYKFNEEFPLPGGEDLELFWRLFKHGHRFIWSKDIRMSHHRNGSITDFIRQAYIYGRGNLLTKFLHNDQPLLKELKTGKFSFWVATLVNVIKIPRFSFILGRKLIKENNIKNAYKKISIYLYFMLHKIFYIFGNISEFFRIREKCSAQQLNHASHALILDITHSCNLSCRICDIWKTKNTEKDLDISYIKKMLWQAKDLKIKEIALSGGEPLLRKDIFDIFEYAKDLEIKDLGVLTNGILAESFFPRLRPYLIDNIISPVISLDSLNPEIHNFVRDSDIAWQKTKKALNRLSALKKEYLQVNFNIITIILNQNLEELLELANFIKNLGTNSLQFQVILPNNLRMAERKMSSFWIPRERLTLLDKMLGKLIEFKRKNPKFIKNSTSNLSLIKKYFQGTITSNDVQCQSAEKTILVSNQGNCTTCFSSYGDIKTLELKDIFESKERLKASVKVKKCAWPCLLPCFCDL
ncbi:MAG: glycosyltransferase [Candidatus Omnitrophica bacterium]|nr:glycosyltransferase [Candidatus Omnitrophota bacterium]MBU3934038.1 glycosyltransferase [Candidatus Omnitrophota bacterium]